MIGDPSDWFKWLNHSEIWHICQDSTACVNRRWNHFFCNWKCKAVDFLVNSQEPWPLCAYHNKYQWITLLTPQYTKQMIHTVNACVLCGLILVYLLIFFKVACCLCLDLMLSTFHVSSRIVANISESSLLLSQKLFGLCWRKTLPEKH